jgi:hypothetical protein
VLQDLREDHSSEGFDNFNTGLGSNPYHRMKPRPMLPEPVTSNVRGLAPNTRGASLAEREFPEYLRIIDDPITLDSAGIPAGKIGAVPPVERLSASLKDHLRVRASQKADAKRFAKIKRKMIERGQKGLHLDDVLDPEATAVDREATVMDCETTHRREESPKSTRTKSNKKVTTAAKGKGRGKIAMPKDAPKGKLSGARALETIDEHRVEPSVTGHGKQHEVIQPEDLQMDPHISGFKKYSSQKKATAPEALQVDPPIPGFKKYNSQKKAIAPETNAFKQQSQQTISDIDGQLPEDNSKQKKAVSEKRKEPTKTSSSRPKENDGKAVAKNSLSTASHRRKTSAPRNPTSAPRGIQGRRRFSGAMFDDGGDSPEPEETALQKPEEPVLTFSSVMEELGGFKTRLPESQVVGEKAFLGKQSQAKGFSENASLKEPSRDTMDPKTEASSKASVVKAPSLLDPKDVFRGLSVHKKRLQTQAPPDKRDRKEPSGYEEPDTSIGLFSESRDAVRLTLRSLTANSLDGWNQEREIEMGDEAESRPFHPTWLPESTRDTWHERTQSDSIIDSGFRSFNPENHRRPTKFTTSEKPLNYGDDPVAPKPAREQETKEAVHESGIASQHTVESQNDSRDRQPTEEARYSAWPEGKSSYENLRLPRPNHSDHRFEQPSNPRRSRNPLPPQEQVVARTFETRGSRDRSPFGNRRRSPEKRASPFGARQTEGARSPAWGGRRFDRGGRRGDRFHPYNRTGSRERTDSRGWAPEERGRESRRERAWERDWEHDRERERERERERSWVPERERW